MQDDIVKMLAAYTPSQDVIDHVRNKKIIIVAGITSAGKNTIMNELIKTGEYHDLVTSTTRAPRENDGVMEVEGVDYHFLTTEEAISKVKNGEYIEVAWVHERINGLLADEVERAQDEGKIPIIDVNVEGVASLKKISEKAIAIFILPPSYSEWIRRMKKRYPTEGQFNEVWPVRRRSAIMELETALSAPYYHFVVNEDLAEAVNAVDRIAHGEDKFRQIDKSFHIWAEKILAELKSDSDNPA